MDHFSFNKISPSIFLYETVVDFSEKIVELSELDSKNWQKNNLNNLSDDQIKNWKNEQPIILSYNKYPISFSFDSSIEFIALGKIIFDYVKSYAKNNLTDISSFNHCELRKYSDVESFLEIESGDNDNQNRKITSLLFLNNVDYGGEVSFKNFNASVLQKTGSLLVFPSCFAYSFRINKPKLGDAYVVVSHFV